ncbi:MAG: hypothetical protein WA431_08905 [Candidatus Cybelea sp.]
MTRLGLISGLAALPFVAIGAKAPMLAPTASGKTIVFPPGVYRIAPEGGIHVVGGDDIYIKGCVFEGARIG